MADAAPAGDAARGEKHAGAHAAGSFLAGLADHKVALYGGVVVAGVVIGLYLKKRNGTAATTATAPGPAPDASGYQSGYLAGLQQAGGGGGSFGAGPTLPQPVVSAPSQPVSAPTPGTPQPAPGSGTPTSSAVVLPPPQGPAEVASQQQQPQNQPAANPNVSPAPVVQLQQGQSLPAASGTGQRYVDPNGYAFTYG